MRQLPSTTEVQRLLRILRAKKKQRTATTTSKSKVLPQPDE